MAGKPPGVVAGMRGWRKMTWALVLWTVAIIVLAISVSGSRSCQSVDGVTQVCSGGLDAGKALLLWAGGFAILGLIWVMRKPQTRLCPACGESVNKGPTRCTACNFDFAAAAGAASGGPR